MRAYRYNPIHYGAVMQGLRHVIAPPSAVWRHHQMSRWKSKKGRIGEDKISPVGDIASPYVKKVRFVWGGIHPSYLL